MISKQKYYRDCDIFVITTCFDYVGGCVMYLRRRALLGAVKNVENFEGKVGSLAIGTLVSISMNDVPVKFLVVHQGNPDKAIYDSSCDGTWLLIQDTYTERMWDTRNYYPESSIATWLEGTFMGYFPEAVVENILTVKVPYHAGGHSNYDGQLHILDDGFTCRAFLPSLIELGVHASDLNISKTVDEGTVLEYFVGTDVEDPLRGSDARYWLRSPYLPNGTDDYTVNPSTGKCVGRPGTSSYGIRPMIILRRNTPLDSYVFVVES